MGGWFVFTNPEKIDLNEYYQQTLKENDYNGWKLHLSVEPTAIEDAFDLVAPIISRYCPIFKVYNTKKIERTRDYVNENEDANTDTAIIIPDKNTYPFLYQQYLSHCQLSEQLSNRTRVGMQLVIYLETLLSTNDATSTLLDTKAMIHEVTTTLEKAGIAPGKPPSSDVSTLSPYFSMRNDAFDVRCLKDNEVIRERFYLTAAMVNLNANPCNSCNLPNNYSFLLQSASPSFNFIDHFQTLLFINHNQLEFNLYLLTVAALREYTRIDELSEKALLTFKNNCFNLDKSLKKDFLKPFYHDNAEIESIVRRTMSEDGYSSYDDSQFSDNEDNDLANESDSSENDGSTVAIIQLRSREKNHPFHQPQEKNAYSECLISDVDDQEPYIEKNSKTI